MTIVRRWKTPVEDKHQAEAETAQKVLLNEIRKHGESKNWSKNEIEKISAAMKELTNELLVSLKNDEVEIHLENTGVLCTSNLEEDRLISVN